MKCAGPRIWSLLLCTVLLTAAAAPAPAAPAGAPKAARGLWKVGPNDFVHYRLDVKRFGDGAVHDARLPEPVRSAFGFFGYELVAGERPRRPFYEEEWTVLPYVLWMPTSLTRPARSIPIDERFEDYGRQHSQIHTRGKLSVKAVRKTPATHEVDLVGLVLFETRPYQAVLQKVRSQDPTVRGGRGRLTWQATFDVSAGLMRHVSFSLSLDRAIVGMYPNGTGRNTANRMTFEGSLQLNRRFPYRYKGFKRNVGSAIERGMQAMRAQRDDAGVWAGRSRYPMGESALGLLTLVKGGWDRSDVDLQTAVDWLIAQKPEGTYSVGLALAAIEAWRAPGRELGMGEGEAASKHGTRVLTQPERAFAKAMTTYLLENATRGTSAPPRTPNAKRRRPRDKPEPVTGGAKSIRWGYPGRHRGLRMAGPQAGRASRHWDNSNSQYAVLGLHSASLCEVEVPRNIWFGIIAHFLAQQRAKGPSWPRFTLRGPDDKPTAYVSKSRYGPASSARGWGYTHLDGDERREFTSAYGSMTCAGISSLAIAHGALLRRSASTYGKKKRQEVLAAIRDGFAFLDRNWASWGNPRQGRYYYLYYLYGLERAAMLTGTKWIGAHDWYWEGAMHLILSQEEDGGWNRSPTDTAFAVLFLKRGTKPVTTPR